MNIDYDEIDLKLHRITFLCGQITEEPLIKLSLVNLTSMIYEIMKLVKEIAALRSKETGLKI